MTSYYKVRAVERKTGRIIARTRGMIPLKVQARAEKSRLQKRLPHARVEILRFSCEVVS